MPRIGYSSGMRGPSRREEPWSAVGRVGLATGALVLGWCAAGGAQELPFRELVEVRVVNLEVVATDAEGAPIRGLSREDFELRIDGEPFPITYFFEVADGRPVAAAGDGSRLPDVVGRTGAGLPHLALVLDGRRVGAQDVRRAIEQLLEMVPGLVDSSRAVLVATVGAGLQIRQPFTSSRAALERALRGVEPQLLQDLDSRGRRALLQRIDRAEAPVSANNAAEQSLIEKEALALLQEIRTEATIERAAATRALDDLRGLVAALGGIPGRKTLVYVGAGLETRPGEALVRAWWAKFASLAEEVGSDSVELEMSRSALDFELERLAETARAAGVQIDTALPGGGPVPDLGVDLRETATIQVLASFRPSSLESLESLATATGGHAFVTRDPIAGVRAAIERDHRWWYSLGFDAPGEAGEPWRGRAEVRLRGRGGRLRHAKVVTLPAASERLEQETLAALLLESERNPLAVSVELARPERPRSGRRILPLRVRIPFARLTLLPEAESHRGSVSLVVVARAAGGALSRPVHARVPIRVANDELLATVGQLAGARLAVEVSDERQRVAIGVRDDVSGLVSTVRLLVEARSP